MGSELVVLTYLRNSDINLLGSFWDVLLVAIHGKVILATATKAVTTLDVSLEWSQQILLVRVLGPAWVGRLLGMRGGTGDNNICRECGCICTWQVRLEVQGKGNVLLLVLVGVIKYHLEGGLLYISGSVHAAMEVGVVLLDILLDLGVQASQVHRTQILTVITHIRGMQMMSDIPELCIIHMHSHAHIVSISINCTL